MSLKEPMIYIPFIFALGFVAGALAVADARHAMAQDPCPPCPPCECPELEPCVQFSVEDDFDLEDEAAIIEAFQAIEAVEKIYIPPAQPSRD